MIRSDEDESSEIYSSNIVTSVLKKAAKVLYYRHKRTSSCHSKPPIWTGFLLKASRNFGLGFHTREALEYWFGTEMEIASLGSDQSINWQSL
ncbi:unnamed protein product [Cuscuta campestris]|uniref:Uncharacterized protein n=1 Tax=Cuscuta campestris TaxID=132261 RepID=A0A484MTS8_9ASTE|nr:unnamed protein product [Cuscuta campestris]